MNKLLKQEETQVSKCQKCKVVSLTINELCLLKSLTKYILQLNRSV